MNYILKIKIFESYLLDYVEESILIKSNLENKTISFLNFNFEYKWSIPIDNLSGDYLKISFERFIYFDNGKSIFANLKDGIVVKSEAKYYYVYREINKVFIDLSNSEKIQIKNNSENYFVNNYNGFKLFIKQLFLVNVNSKQKLIAFSLLNGKELWQRAYTDLFNEEDTTISNEIVEVSGVIYFLLHGGGKNECFGLDANTGEVVKRIPNILGDIIVENEFIYFLHAENITIYNTQKDEIITWEIENLMIEKGIERLWFPRWAIDNGLIYFSQSKGADRNSDSVGARFGVLDPTKKELLWHDKLPLENGIIGSIKVNQNRIYLHTQDQTLFIYEKE